MKLLTQALVKLGGETEEGGAVMSAMQTLNKVFAKHQARTDELIPAELKSMMQGLKSPMAGGMPPGGAPGGMPGMMKPPGM